MRPLNRNGQKVRKKEGSVRKVNYRKGSADHYFFLEF